MIVADFKLCAALYDVVRLDCPDSDCYWYAEAETSTLGTLTALAEEHAAEHAGR